MVTGPWQLLLRRPSPGRCDPSPGGGVSWVPWDFKLIWLIKAAALRRKPAIRRGIETVSPSDLIQLVSTFLKPRSCLFKREWPQRGKDSIGRSLWQKAIYCHDNVKEYNIFLSLLLLLFILMIAEVHYNKAWVHLCTVMISDTLNLVTWVTGLSFYHTLPYHFFCSLGACRGWDSFSGMPADRLQTFGFRHSYQETIEALLNCLSLSIKSQACAHSKQQDQSETIQAE